ncbi:RND family transporter [Schlesneria sp. DSM 10557]|uniref:efflux RND transporter permease subunit n=1 Tax=Schlesneria sp. DSM 10557 TaxID=3044399 RepID=UPI0035A00FE2
MISQFYRRYSVTILWLVGLSFPWLWYQAEQMPANNDIETWLPRETPVRLLYEEFKQDFGAEEVLVIGIPQELVTSKLVEAFASRMERLEGIRHCWTPDRMTARMQEFGVDEKDARERLDGLLTSKSGELIGIVAQLTDWGIKNRAQVVEDTKETLTYCQLPLESVALTGAPVIVTELDRLGSQKTSRQFFLLTIGISLGLLYYSFGHWGLSLAVLGTALWGIFLNQTIMCFMGGEMNFIMGSLSVMVMIFTLSISVHVVSYYDSAHKEGHPEPLTAAIVESFNPCMLSTLTTLMGLISLNVSTILPVSQFGYAAACGAVVALIVGLGITPALLTVMPHCMVRSVRYRINFRWWGSQVAAHRGLALGGAAILLGITFLGILKLEPSINPTEFLPRNSKILSDLRRIQSDLTNVDSIEAVVDLGGEKLAFMDQLQKIRTIEAKIAAHPGVRHTLSLATFFPEEMPDSTMAAARILGHAKSYSGEEGFVAARQRLWRISARIRHDSGLNPVEVLNQLTEQLADEPLHFTGLTPLLKNAQQEIFDGFWESFTAACLTISIVMILSLRSVVAGIVAMIPNIIPIWLVFGSVGFLGMPVDIGMMMTGSIALGISVDCTFHFLVKYQAAYRNGASSKEAVLQSLEHSGEPMLDSTLISALGMLALCFSSFAPTARFGCLMASQMLASLLGELVILPAMLCCRPGLRRQTAPEAANEPAPASKLESVPQIHPFPAELPAPSRRARAVAR